MALNNLDLELQTLWFTKTPPAFPTPKMRALGLLTAEYGWEHWDNLKGGKDWEFIGVIQFEDFSITKIKLNWDSTNPCGTVKAEQKFIAAPIPAPLTDDQLELAHEWYGQHIVDWCRSKVGTKVGDGECWTFADEALKSVAPKAIRQGPEPPGPSRGKEHGQCILTYSVGDQLPTEGLLEMAKVKPGDIMDMEDGHFKKVQYHPVWNLRSEENVRFIHHTAIIVGVQGDRMKVVEQNTAVGKMVSEGSFKLADMQSGTVRIFRPVGQSCGPLSVKGMSEKW